MKAVRIAISGQVQGVGFRVWLKDEADRARVSGWVSNRRDRSVEAVLAGEDHAVDRLLTLCRSGPPGAEVAEIRLLQDAAAAPAPGFSIRQTF